MQIKELLVETDGRCALTRDAGERNGMAAGKTRVCGRNKDDAGIDRRAASKWVAPWTVQHPNGTRNTR